MAESTFKTMYLVSKSDLDNKLAKTALSQLTASQQDKLDELNTKLNSMISSEQSLLSGELVDVNSMLSAAQGDSAASGGHAPCQPSSRALGRVRALSWDPGVP